MIAARIRAPMRLAVAVASGEVPGQVIEGVRVRAIY